MFGSLAKSLFRRKTESPTSETIDGSPIQEQEITRYITIGIIFLYLAYLQLSGRIENLATEPISRVIAGYLIGTLLIQVGIFKKAQESYLITAALALDVMVLTVALFILGENSAAFFPVYFWLIVGNGVRYGLRYLRATAVLSFIAFFLVLQNTPYWQQNAHLGYGLLAGLAVIPRYLAKLIRQLNHALESATEANKVKTQFMANMSHELRTPLTGILASADMLKDEDLEGDVKTKINMISSSANTLMSMIGDVLDVSKVESGHLEISNPEEANLLPQIKNLESVLGPLLQTKTLDIVVDIEPAMLRPAYLSTPEFKQILINLVGNAVKFTQMGEVRIRGRCDDVDGKPGWRIEIQDTGIGMPAEVLDSIFDPFIQADSGVTRQHTGTGLGTAICKELVSLMGGHIGVESELGKGSTFWFKIPITYVEEEQVLIPLTSAPVFALDLIAEEKEQLKRYFGDCLISDLDFSDSTRAIQRLLALDTKNFILISGKDLSDHRYDQVVDTLAKNGLANALNIRLNQEYGQCLLSSSNGQRSRKLALIPDTDPAIVNHIVSGYIKETRPRSESLELIRPLEILVADDAPTNRDILRMMLEKQGHHVTLAHDGLEAIERLSHAEQSFELVILDRNMPGMDGINVLKTHRVSNSWQNGTSAKFILLTADASKETKKAALQAGMDSFMTKPLLAKDIQLEIFRLFPTLFIEAPVPDGAPNLELAVDNTKLALRHLVDYEVLDNLGNMSPQGNIFVTKMVNSFLNDAKAMVAELNNGFETRDYSQALEAAHALKGSALQIGAPVLADYCDRLRQIARIDFTAEKCQLLKVELNDLYDATVAEFTRHLEEIAKSEDQSSSSKPQ